MPKVVRLHLAALGFYAALAFITLHPIVFHTGTHYAGYDFFAFHWNFWWIRHALSTPDLSVWTTNYLMLPSENTLAYHTLSLIWYPLWAVLEPVIGTLAAVNVITFVGSVANGYVLFFYLWRERAPLGWALLAGMVIQLMPTTRYLYYNTHLNLFVFAWLPIHLMLWQQLVTAIEAQQVRRSAFWVVGLALGLFGLAMTDLQYPLFVGFLLIPVGLYTLWRSPQRFWVAASGTVSVALSVALMWASGLIPAMLAFEGGRVTSPVEERPNIDFPTDFVRMADTWWDWATPSLGWFITGLVIVALVMAVRTRFFRDRELMLWFVIFLPPFILSLGPTLTLGNLAIPMPYRFLYDITGGQFRMPWRLTPIFATALLIFLGKLWRHLPPMRGQRAVLIFGVLIFGYALSIRLFEGGPVAPIPTAYAFYDTIGTEPNDRYGVIEIPTGAGSGEVLLGDINAIQYQWYGIFHHKPMLNSFIARAPLDNYWYIHVDDPMLAWLGQRRQLEPGIVAEQLRDRVASYPIGYLVIHQDAVRRNGGSPEEIITFFNGNPDAVCPWRVEGEAVVYRSTTHPAGCPPRMPPQESPDSYVIDLGNNGDQAFLGIGWHWAEPVGNVNLRWAGNAELASLVVDLPVQAYTLTISAQAFWEPRELSVSVNGTFLDESYTIQPDSLQDVRFSLPPAVLGDGTYITVRLHYDAAIRPADVLESGDQRPLAVAVESVRFVPARN